MENKYSALTHYEFLRLCIHSEALGLEREFTWGRVFRRYLRNRHIRFQIKWRFAHYFYAKGGKFNVKFANWLNDRITERYNVEIGLSAVIGPGFRIGHHNGIVIASIARIGSNFMISQNTTIGIKDKGDGYIVIGDNVKIGANSCIISDNMKIGNNVIVGAQTFLNKDLADDVICFTKREYTIITRSDVPESAA